MPYLMLAIALTTLGCLTVWLLGHGALPTRRRRRPGTISDYQSGLRALSERQGQRFTPPRSVVPLDSDSGPSDRQER